jgi:hypothetical protein
MLRRLPAVLLFLLAPLALGATRDNDDSCDIAVLPAATLLLPYFEVDLAGGTTTLFTIVNVTNQDRVAHVTLWTDRGEPTLDFNIFLTGYDVQAVNLFDVLARGIVAPEDGTGLSLWRRRGQLAIANPGIDLTTCQLLPGPLDSSIMTRVRSAFTEGHARAIGYATVDVVESCTAEGPTDPDYWTRDLRYDNVFTGDWQFVDAANEAAHGAPLVHIRAVPEGSTPQSRRAFQVGWEAGFPRTFYASFQPPDAPGLDGRQPLPSLFAARWTEGTSLQVWREPRAGSTAFAATELVAFDENENGAGISTLVTLPTLSATAIADPPFPQLPNGAESGWIYLNLDAGTDRRVASQNWVVSTTRSAGRSTAADAAALGNGCSSPAGPSEVSFRGGAAIAPAPDGHGRGRAETGNDDSCDISQMPAATLLLPRFDVDIDGISGVNASLSVTNTGPRDQIARVTLWTDLAFPVMTFNLYLTGYDVQTIDLHDVFTSGRWPVTGFLTSARGANADANGALDLTGCGQLGGAIGADFLERLRRAFTNGSVSDLHGQPGCDEVGLDHDNAVGYATIDVVRNCNVRNAMDPAYWDDVAYDNVLIGDYQQDGDASPLVHIRAVDGLTRTFYGTYQTAAAPARDRRQPLPSRFAARWISGGTDRFQTHYAIWREPTQPRPKSCGNWDNNLNGNPVTEIVTFDENENWVGDVPICRVTCLGYEFALPPSSVTSVRDASIYPQLSNGASAGWMYINLDNGPGERSASQNWVSVTMRAGMHYSAGFHATALGNGCSPDVRASQHTTGTVVVGPSPNSNPPP